MCDSCEVLNINGVNCHEIGCPDSWRDYDKDCMWCGTQFSPEYKEQECCCQECVEAYYS